MAITQCMTTSFKVDILKGDQDILVDTFKIALYESTATLDASTTVYTTSGEITGTGYVAGGNTLTGASVSSSGTTAFVSFSNSSWAGASFTARGALIYNSSKADASVCILDFGSDKTVTNGNFTVQFPAADASTAVLRIA